VLLDLVRNLQIVRAMQLQWREADTISPAAQFISSPYDAEAHYDATVVRGEPPGHRRRGSVLDQGT
jgi:hypothetical protein